ncbi:hypothetical protein C7212DRAFT_366029 [Tuber magnatum]|uniref:Uncharacterized protein n=1 Tax=Tuber magnatum TaxID=42249 RepID=A0A317SIA4_9PEZI|nr:hypothetical protein C7212DRAFT_366029 [Tuber magnatum]
MHVLDLASFLFLFFLFPSRRKRGSGLDLIILRPKKYYDGELSILGIRYSKIDNVSTDWRTCRLVAGVVLVGSGAAVTFTLPNVMKVVMLRYLCWEGMVTLRRLIALWNRKILSPITNINISSSEAFDPKFLIATTANSTSTGRLRDQTRYREPMSPGTYPSHYDLFFLQLFVNPLYQSVAPNIRDETFPFE